MPFETLPPFLRRKLPGSGDFSHRLEQYLPGNRLTIFSRGEEIFKAMWEAIDSARDSIHLETYRFSPDKTGEAFAERLKAKARLGVSVRVILDAIGSIGTDWSFLNRLRNAGVQVLDYRPPAPWRPKWGLGRRDHRKNLIVDGRVAFTGGVNISDDHAPPETGGLDWHDVHVRLEGPAVFELERAFRAVWFKETGRYFPIKDPPATAAGGVKVWVAANQELLHRTRIRRAFLKAVRASQREVLIANAYFLPDFKTRRTLAAAARRGVDVRILVQGHTDVPAAWYAGRARYDYLLERGVRLFEWQGPMLHAKTAAIDETWSTVGSYNLDHRSLLHNLECNLNILDAAFSKQLAALLRADTRQSRELTLKEWRKRPLREKLLERFFSLFRYFL